MTPTPRRVLVVGNGMAGARLAEEIRHRDPEASRFSVTVVGEEPHAAYNRVLLSTVVAGGLTPRETRLKPDGWWTARHVEVVTGARVTAVDTASRTATLTGADGAQTSLAWDELVLATGSTAFVPPTEGLYAAAPGPDAELADGVVAFRTVDDSSRIVAAAESASTAVVLGGGLLGLEAARGLLARGVEVTIVHPQDFPMDRQLDVDGGAVLTRVVRGIGARLVLGQLVTARHPAGDGEPAHVVLSDGSAVPADLVVVAAGVRPRTDLAVAMGLEVDRAVVVDDRLATSAPHVHAIGECSQHRGAVPGLVQPGWDQARVLADVLTGSDAAATYEGTSVLTRLKAHDIDLASMGTVDVDVHDPGHEVLAFTDPSRGRYAKLVLRQDRLVGAILLGVGDAAGPLTQLYDTGAAVPRDRLALMLGRAVTRSGAPETASLAEMPGSAVICRCNTVTKSAIVGAFRAGADTVAHVADATRATTGCGSCKSAVDGLCSWLRSAEPGSSPTEHAPPAASAAPTSPAQTSPAPVPATAALTEGAA
ncbi:FAD-dependent oxidoreductase [Terrabacter terrigena]|uniref:FAD-dependent oxidoreductase n=1 Tax=Terrabacter terrigena TaxID=574718 RepID=A0ABW3MVF5_9MICO